MRQTAGVAEPALDALAHAAAERLWITRTANFGDGRRIEGGKLDLGHGTVVVRNEDDGRRAAAAL
jgi:hypothetical protein